MDTRSIWPGPRRGSQPLPTSHGHPPELIRLSPYGPDGTYCGREEASDPRKRTSSEMLRRLVLALGGVAAFGAPIERLGELVKPASPAPRRCRSSLTTSTWRRSRT